jgi:hypothetical protein
VLVPSMDMGPSAWASRSMRADGDIYERRYVLCNPFVLRMGMRMCMCARRGALVGFARCSLPIE